MKFNNIREIINSIKSKELSPREVTEYYLNRISEHNHKFNAFITILEDEALKRAKEAESEITKILMDTKHPYHNKEHPGHQAAVDEMAILFDAKVSTG